MKIFHWLRRLARAGYVHLALLPLAWARVRRGRRLLVVSRPGAVGDILATRPALCALRRAHLERTLVYLTRPEFRGVAALLPEADQVVAVWKPDSVGEAAQRWCDVRFPRYEEEAPALADARHFALDMAASVGADGARLDDLYLPVAPRPPAAPPLILLHTGPTAPVREWPAAKWLELLARLRAAGHGAFEQIWFEKHFLHSRTAHPTLPGVPVLARPDPAALAARLRGAALFIGVESGPLHLARAVRTPRVGLFGPTAPALRTTPAPEERICHLSLPCQFCHHRRPRLHWQTGCPHDIACLRQLPVEAVLAACLELLPAPAK